MDARSQARLKIAQSALLLLRSRDFRNVIPGTSMQGDHVIIPGLPDDEMGRFLDHLRDAQGPVYVVTPDGPGLVVLALNPAHAPKHAAPGQENDCPVYRGTHLQMVVSLLKASRTGIASFYEAPQNVWLELVNKAEDLADASA